MLTITALAKKTGVLSKTLRYWESLGLLPKPTRSHTGYRLFNQESVQRVEFILKAKSIGLSLAEIAKVLQLARRGANPCPQVARWAEEKVEMLEQQIHLLSSLRRSLHQFQRMSSRKMPCPRAQESEICCLIEDLPTPKFAKGGKSNEKALGRPVRRFANNGD